MKFIKLSLAAALLATGMLAADESEIGISANVAATNNYVWRGMSQTQDQPAIQGGVDLDFKGFYVGVWGSSVNFADDIDTSMEIDVYAGYAGEIASFSYDVGYIQYMFPGTMDESNLGEAYVSLGYDFEVVSIGASYAMGVETDAIDATDNVEGTVSIPLPMEFSIDATYGDYDKVGTHYLVGLNKSFGKFDFTVAYTGMDYDDTATDSENNFVASVGTSF